MPAFIKKGEITLTIAARDQWNPVHQGSIPWMEWTSIHFEVIRAFEVAGMEHRFTVRAGGAYDCGQLDIEVRCDGAEEWVTIDNIPWSPDSIVDTRYFPRTTCQKIRYLIFIDICEAEKILADQYIAASMRVVDDGSGGRERDGLAQTLRALRERFGRGTLARRIDAEIRLAGTSLSADVLIGEVMGQPGASSDGSEILEEIERASSTTNDATGYLIRIPGRKPNQSILADDPLPDTFELAFTAPSEVVRRGLDRQRAKDREIAGEHEQMDAARAATAARKARETEEGYVQPTDLIPVTWTKGWDGYASASCGTDPFVCNGQINRSSTGSGLWTVIGGWAEPARILAEDEDAARYALEQRLRVEVARKVALAATMAPKPGIEVHVAPTEARPS